MLFLTPAWLLRDRSGSPMLCSLALSDPKIACTNVPPHLAQLPAVTNNFNAVQLKFWCESVTVSRWKVRESIGLYSIVTLRVFWQIQASTPFLRGTSKVPEDWALSALFTAPDFKHSCTFIGVWRSRPPLWNQSEADPSSNVHIEKPKAGSKPRNSALQHRMCQCRASVGLSWKGFT